MFHILFVCTGNTCRSPLAEGMLKLFSNQHQVDVEVRSAGILTQKGLAISSHSKAILKEIGCETNKLSKQIDHSDIAWSDYILTMTNHHKQSVIRQYPESLEKTYTLKEFVSDDLELKALIELRDQWAVDYQLKLILSHLTSEHEYNKLIEIEKRIPSSDIADPFGGTFETYQKVADEIKENILQLVNKLKLLK